MSETLSVVLPRGRSNAYDDGSDTGDAKPSRNIPVELISAAERVGKQGMQTTFFSKFGRRDRTVSNSERHTHPDTDGKRKKEKGKREKGRPREDKGGGRRELSTPSHHARRERVAPHHRRLGARRSCPVASPPAASSSLQLRRHQRPEPREMRPRGGTSAREETRKKDCRHSTSPTSNCYSRRALSPSPLSFNHHHLCWGSLSLLNEEGEFESASEGRNKESRWRSRSPSSHLLLPSTELVVRGASPTSLLMNRLYPCFNLAQPHTPFILVSKSAQFFPCSDSIYETPWKLLPPSRSKFCAHSFHFTSILLTLDSGTPDSISSMSLENCMHYEKKNK
ncbi:hypothetical protein Ahy_A02g009891 [Arachis hypogaea]|uniref:Uncharacterized protein n=1 Tax=Arachis hypogaea TaxID=3818 RepID=A0A445EIP9_ARAHY|nr:hypothetical protein Ahy_A02g009891 [Arachis hypogaea]